MFIIFRMSLIGFGGSGSQVDSARMNLASSFVNGFVNAAFGQDKLLTDDGNKWLYKNKDHGKNLLCCYCVLCLHWFPFLPILLQYDFLPYVIRHAQCCCFVGNDSPVGC